MSIKFDLFPINPLTAARFRAWLARSERGASLEYHRGLLIFDRSPTSELAEEERRRVGRIADAAFRAAADGQVHLVQRRHGDCDFAYLAIKRGQNAVATAALPVVHAHALPAAA